MLNPHSVVYPPCKRRIQALLDDRTDHKQEENNEQKTWPYDSREESSNNLIEALYEFESRCCSHTNWDFSRKNIKKKKNTQQVEND